MSPRHTPGPWTVARIDRESASYGIRCPIAELTYKIAEVLRTEPGRDTEGMANALLISASPRMFLALTLVRQSLAWHALGDEVKRAIDIALIQAEGKQS